MTEEPKHLSQLSAATRALAQQQIQNALLAIVAMQGADVVIPVIDMDLAADQFALVVEQFSDKEGNKFVRLSCRLGANAVEIHQARPHEIEAIAEGKLN